MARKRKRDPKTPYNFLTKPLLVVWISGLGFVGIVTLTDNQAMLSGIILPLVLLLGLATLAWTIQCWRLGCVAMVGNMGQVYHYHRKHGPVGFYLVMLLYAFGCAGLLFYPTQQLFFSA